MPSEAGRRSSSCDELQLPGMSRDFELEAKDASYITPTETIHHGLAFGQKSAAIVQITRGLRDPLSHGDH